MRYLRVLFLRVSGLFDRKARDRELSEELAAHLVMHIDDNLRLGMTPGEARRQALLKLGGMEQTKENYRDRRGLPALETFAQDLRYALRTLRKSPGFALLAVLVLALGIGMNTAIFSVVDAVMLRLLPVGHPHQLVLLQWSAKGWPEIVHDLEGNSGQDARTGLSTSTSLPYPVYQHLRDHNHALSKTFGFAANSPMLNVSLAGRTESADSQIVSGNFFEGLEVRPALGRLLLPADDTASAPPAAVISYRYWQNKLGLDPAVVGKTAVLNGVPYTIVGIAPPRFFGLNPSEYPDIWVPIATQFRLMHGLLTGPDEFGKRPTRDPLLTDPKIWWLVVVGRLRPGVSKTQAQAELSLLFNQSLAPALKSAPHVHITPALEVLDSGRGLDYARQELSRPLALLLALAGLVLLIACANVAGLMLARASARQKEIAVRLSLGAGRSRLVRLLLTESLTLALLGGVAGLIVAMLTRGIVERFFASGNNHMILDLRLNLTVMLFTAAVSMLTGVLCGIGPAWRATHHPLAPALKEKSQRSGSSGHRFLSGRILVAGQVALCLVLLVSAGLFVRTLQNLETIDLGFNRENLLLFEVQPGLNGYADAHLAAYYQELQRRIEAISGVVSVAFSDRSMIGAGESTSSATFPRPSSKGPSINVHRCLVGPGFFSTLQIPTVLGRTIGPQDNPKAPKIAVVNQALVNHFLQGVDPIGQSVDFGDPDHGMRFEIVGVVKDTKLNRLRAEDPPVVYLSYQQLWGGLPAYLTYQVRTAANPGLFVAEIRRVAQSLDKDVPLVEVRTQVAAIDQSLVLERVFTALTSLFGVLALVLVCVGLFGTISYMVGRRTNEIGIRMALGAQRHAVLWMVMREGLQVVGVGVVLGLAAAAASTRLLASQLYGLKPSDPRIALVAALLLLGVTSLAGYLPAWRASRVDPMVALRDE